jgi:replicative DNA helicase
MENFVEKGFLGWILEDKERIHETIIKSSMLTDPIHSEIFKICEGLKKQGKEINFVNILENWTSGSEQKALEYLSSITDIHSANSDFKGFENQILTEYKDKRSREYAEQFGKGGTKDLESFLKKMQEIQTYGIRQDFDKKESLYEVYEHFEQLTAGKKKGIQTGFTEFDRMTGGLQNTDYYIFGARPSLGKTAFMLNLARSVNEANKGNVFHNIFSLEQIKLQIIIRLMNAIGRIDSMKWLTGKFETEDFNKVSMAIGELSTFWDFGVYDKTGMTVPEMRSTLRENMRKHPDKKHVVYIDYMGKIGTTNKHNNENSRITEISDALKAMQRDFKVPVICLTQLSRANEQRQDKRPVMSDIRDSGSVEQDADVIGFLHRDDYYDRETENKNIMEIDIKKARNGTTGLMELAFVKEYGLFMNLDRRYDERG